MLLQIGRHTCSFLLNDMLLGFDCMHCALSWRPDNSEEASKRSSKSWYSFNALAMSEAFVLMLRSLTHSSVDAQLGEHVGVGKSADGLNAYV